MKRWWNLPQQWPVGRTRSRVGRVVAPALMAGAVCIALPSSTLGQCSNSRPATSDSQRVEANCVRLPRTGGAVVQAWAFGTLNDATQPGSQEACDLNHVCALAISSSGGAGMGTGVTMKTAVETSSQTDPAPNLAFTLTETIDYRHAVTRGVHDDNRPGACYPSSGVMTITVDASSVLVLDIVGQACQVSSDTSRLVFTGSYVTDSSSTGTVADADGIGTLSINNPSGITSTETNKPAADSTWLKASLLGQLKYGQ